MLSLGFSHLVQNDFTTVTYQSLINVNRTNLPVQHVRINHLVHMQSHTFVNDVQHWALKNLRDFTLAFGSPKLC